MGDERTGASTVGLLVLGFWVGAALHTAGIVDVWDALRSTFEPILELAVIVGGGALIGITTLWLFSKLTTAIQEIAAEQTQITPASSGEHSTEPNRSTLPSGKSMKQAQSNRTTALSYVSDVPPDAEVDNKGDFETSLTAQE